MTIVVDVYALSFFFFLSVLLKVINFKVFFVFMFWCRLSTLLVLLHSGIGVYSHYICQV